MIISMNKRPRDLPTRGCPNEDGMKNVMKKQIRMLAWFAALVLVFTGVPIASAIPLAPGTTIQAPDIITSDQVTGTLLANISLSVNTGSTTFDYSARVMDPSSPNVFGAGNLNYLYSLTVSAGAPLTQLTMSNFAGVSVDAGFFLAGGGTYAPTNLTRSSAGDVVGFNFGTPIAAPNSMYLLVIETNSPTFRSGTLAVSDGTRTFGLDAFSPAHVPEPTSLLLLGFGLVGLAYWRWKRQGNALV